jgi:hypothetical protein
VWNALDAPAQPGIAEWLSFSVPNPKNKAMSATNVETTTATKPRIQAY